MARGLDETRRARLSLPDQGVSVQREPHSQRGGRVVSEDRVCLYLFVSGFVILLHVAACISHSSHLQEFLPRMNLEVSRNRRPHQFLSLRGGGGGEGGLDSDEQAQLEMLEERMSSHLEGRSKFDESLDNDILQELCRFVVFENQSVPDSSVEAMKKRARGYNESSANWDCLRCGSSVPSIEDDCNLCGTDRELVEHRLQPQHLESSIPEKSHSIARALQKLQAGLNDEWNQRYRSAELSVGAGDWKWDQQELEVLPNMTLSFNGRPKNKCIGRWWLREGSSGHASSVNFLYKHPLRPPYRFGVPTPWLEPTTSYEEMVAFFHGEHPQFDLNPELDLVWCVLDIWGGPWTLEQCSIKSMEAIAVGCALQANVSLVQCEVGGIRDGERASLCIDVGQQAACSVHACHVGNTSCGGTAVQVTQQGAVSVTNCMIETADFGISIDNEGSGRIVGNKFSECIWATWYLGLSGETSTWILEDNEVFGPGWHDERRPRRLTERGNVVNDTLLYHRGWQELSKQRFAEGHRDGFLQRTALRQMKLDKRQRR